MSVPSLVVVSPDILKVLQIHWGALILTGSEHVHDSELCDRSPPLSDCLPDLLTVQQPVLATKD